MRTLAPESPSGRFASFTGNRQIYAAVFIDAIYVKIRDGQVGNRPIYAAIGVDLAGHKDILGLWAGTGGGESAKFWLQGSCQLSRRS